MPLPEQAASEEPISRFIFSDKVFSRRDNRVKYGAFIPPRRHPLELSVYRIMDLGEPEVWRLAVEHIETETRKTKARADLRCQDVLDLNLKIVPDLAPHPRHANITGWNEQDLEELQFAVDLARKAILNLKP